MNAALRQAILTPHWWLGLRSVLAASTALLIALAMDWPYPHWAAITVVVLMTPNLSSAVALFPLRIAGVAIGAMLGFLIVAVCGQDRTPFLLACSTVLFIVGIGTSSPRFGTFFLMLGIAFPPVAFFGITDFEHAPITAFYRFAAASLGVLVFTASHILIFAKSVPSKAAAMSSARPALPWLLGIPRWRWFTGLRCALGCAIAILLWYEIELPGKYGEAIMACVLLAVCSAFQAPRILFALGGIICGIGAAFLVTYFTWALLGLGPEIMFLSVFPVLLLFALIQSHGPPYALFGIFGSLIFLIALGITQDQGFDPSKFFGRGIGLIIGGVVTVFALRILWPSQTESQLNRSIF